MKTKIHITTAKLLDTRTGKQYLQVVDQGGNKFSCWEEILWPELQGAVGKEIEVEIAQKGKYANIVGAGSMLPDGDYFGGYDVPTVNVEDTKTARIKEAMDSKEQAVRIASTMRDAVLIVTSLRHDLKDDAAIKFEIAKWRQWLWDNWERTTL